MPNTIINEKIATNDRSNIMISLSFIGSPYKTISSSTSTPTSTRSPKLDHDWFKIKAAVSNTYKFNMNSVAGSSLNTLLSLKDSNGNLLVSNDDANSGTNSEFTYTAASTGDHYLDAGSSVLPMPLEVGNTASTAYQITAGNSVSSTISLGGDLDWFRINLTSQNTCRFNLNLTQGSGNIDPVLTLRGPISGYSSGELAVWTKNDDYNGLNSQITFTPTLTGKYCLDVCSYVNSQSGGYTLNTASLH